MFNNGFELFVEVDGRRIPEFGHKGKTYFEGRKNHRCQIHFRNSRPERVLVVPSVDGISVINGQPCREMSPGYVVQAYSSLVITGWRTSLDEVRTFEFTGKAESYAGKVAEHLNCGVIGVKVFAELAQPTVYPFWQGGPVYPLHPVVYPVLVPGTVPLYPSVPLYPEVTCQSTFSAPSTNCCLNSAPGSDLQSATVINSILASTAESAPDFNLGMAYGAPRQDITTYTKFERGLCLATFELFYSDKEGLVKDGIPVDKTPALVSFPQAFGGFCRPPG
jgi:hypothetical protein